MKLLKSIFLIFIVPFIVAILANQFFRPVYVPQLVGLSYERAVQELNDKGVDYASIPVDGNQKNNTVIRQEPSAGTWIFYNRQKVTISYTVKSLDSSTSPSVKMKRIRLPAGLSVEVKLPMEIRVKGGDFPGDYVGELNEDIRVGNDLISMHGERVRLNISGSADQVSTILKLSIRDITTVDSSPVFVRTNTLVNSKTIGWGVIFSSAAVAFIIGFVISFVLEALVAFMTGCAFTFAFSAFISFFVAFFVGLSQMSAAKIVDIPMNSVMTFHLLDSVFVDLFI